MQFWLASGLGFCLNHIEESFDRLFGLDGQPDDYVEFDTSVLMRSAQKDHVDALVRGVQGGIFSPNEARHLEGLDSVDYGDEPRVQQQVVPLSAAANIPSPGEPAPAAPAAPSAAGASLKSYSDAVTRDVEALRARLYRDNKKPGNPSVIRKTKANGLRP